MGIRLLAWDAPNMDMALSQLVKGKPTPQQRPDLAVLQRWFRDRSADGERAESAVFVNVPEHLADRLTGWVLWLTQTGYRVFVKPKIGDSDVDDDIVAYLTGRSATEVSEVVLASHDARAFLEVAEQLQAADVKVTVLGFRELAGRLAQSAAPHFVDVSTIKGLFAELPPRVSLVDLPPEGRWFEPLVSAEHIDLDLPPPADAPPLPA